ncbi:PACE efflux transporter, partial [Pseudomonas aeruginosa]|nr:PACE efflux transporter [Pseudomonas aeruginosa]
MQQTPHQRKTLTERVIHANTFEGLATLILAPTAAWLMQRSVVEMGGLSILLATLAMVWNIIYNAAFDRLWPVSRFPRQLKVRALHALGFETGFVIIGVTMVAIVLGVSLLQAFMLEIG